MLLLMFIQEGHEKLDIWENTFIQFQNAAVATPSKHTYTLRSMTKFFMC